MNSKLHIFYKNNRIHDADAKVSIKIGRKLQNFLENHMLLLKIEYQSKKALNYIKELIKIKCFLNIQNNY